YILNKVQKPVLTFFINGRRIMAKGGSWGMAEYMQRCDAAEYDKKIRLHKDMNYNMIRCWTGCVTDEAFYEACDKYGIMAWDDFWLHSGEGHPDEIDAFKKNALDKVRRLRNHPCIALWCGANESRPLKEIDTYLREIVAKEDHSDRLYKASSNQDGLSGSSPWTNRPPRFHFETSLGGLVLLNPPYPYGIDYGYGCRSEIGMATMPNYESVDLFIPKEEQWPLPEDKVLSEFNDNVWNHHFYGARGGNAGPMYYRDCIYDRYGEPKSLQEYCDKAQYVNLEDMKGIYEAWNDKMGNDASGVLIWMSMSAFPSCVWQTFDYYYDTTGAYYAAKKACEPWHIQWNVVTDAIKVVNASNEDMNHVKAIAHVYDFNGKEITQLAKEKDLSLRAADVTEAFRLDFPRRNVALGCKATASSSTERFPAPLVTDGLMNTRWESEYSDPQWIMVDLGQQRNVATLRILWEGAYSKKYEIQLSDDAENWHTAYANDEGKGGTDIIDITPEKARYIRVMGLTRNSWFGHSIHEIEVYEPKEGNETPIQFIKLELRKENGELVSDNFYWRNSDIELDYKAFASLPEADITATIKSKDVAAGKATVEVENHSATVAFGNRLRLINATTKERILPATMNDNYFTLLPGEKKTITIDAPADQMAQGAKLLLKQYIYNEKEVAEL
ncbi:MAG: discoidin domain-containing protein, partial [Prevotellaceae bacterium]|nr:discoidin domain-containing protein [Prevotellaceae bacterium]